MKHEVHGALIQHPCQDLPRNFQPTYIQQCLVTQGKNLYENPLSLPYKNCFKKEYGVFEKKSARTAEHISQVSSPSVHTS